MSDVLLDTNIVIYLLGQEAKDVAFVERLHSKRVGLSVVTYMEVLVGAGSDSEAKEIRDVLNQFEIISLNVSIADAAATTLRKRTRRSLKDPRLADTLIAHTALGLEIPLVTNNRKDFRRFRALKCIVP